jgi:hypothetical protein
LGQSSSDQTPGLLSPTAVAPPLNKPIPDINWSVDLQGDLSVHIVPQVQMGVSILGGALVDAQVSYLSHLAPIFAASLLTTRKAFIRAG